MENGRPAEPNGLKNQGATCYLNSVLQCLYMTQNFRTEVENLHVRDPKNLDKENSAERKNSDLMDELHKLFKTLNEVDGTTEGITQCLGISNVYEQQDAVEYYQKILKVIHPQISKIFRGEMSNKTKCEHDHEFVETCPFFTIPLSMDTEPPVVFDVERGLKSLSVKIKLDEDNLLYCDECGQKAEAETWTEIEVCPQILAVYLKRFYFDYNQMRLVKNDSCIENYWQLKINNLKYKLYAVINHMGGRNGGHYKAVIRSFKNNEWYLFDDSDVRKFINMEQMDSYLSNNAYLLLYGKDEGSPHSDKTPSTSTHYTEQRDQVSHSTGVEKQKVLSSAAVLCGPHRDPFERRQSLEEQTRMEGEKPENLNEAALQIGEKKCLISSTDNTFVQSYPAEKKKEEEENMPHSNETFSTSAYNKEQHDQVSISEIHSTGVEEQKDLSGAALPYGPSTDKSERRQSLEEQTRMEGEKPENLNEAALQIGEKKCLISSTDNTFVQACMGQEKNVFEAPEVETEEYLLSKEVQEDTEAGKNEKKEQQEVAQLTKNAVAPDDLSQISCQQRHFSSTGKSELIITREMQRINCSPKEDLVLTSDLTRAQTEAGVGHKGDKEVLNLAVVAKNFDLKDTSCEYQQKRSQAERTPEDASQTLCSETRAHEGTTGLSNVSGTISEETSIYLIEFKQNQNLEEDKRDKDCQKVNKKQRKTYGSEGKMSRKKKKRESLPHLKGEMVAQSTEQNSEIQTLMHISVTPNKSERQLNNRKTCNCCTVM